MLITQTFVHTFHNRIESLKITRFIPNTVTSYPDKKGTYTHVIQLYIFT